MKIYAENIQIDVNEKLTNATVDHGQISFSPLGIGLGHHIPEVIAAMPLDPTGSTFLYLDKLAASYIHHY